MDQVFLQESIPPRRHPTSSVLKRERLLLSHLRESPVGPEENHLLGLKFKTAPPPPLKTHTSITMTNHGDDCYFFYYSTCTKGDSCPFRHCEAAMGNETVCNLWQEGRCFRAVCKFRHMEITKNRKEIPCYWENQPAGCQKPHCAFFHEKPRYVDGVFIPPDRSLSKSNEQAYEEPAPPPPALLPTTANPQLRGVIKTETQEPVPSPTHPPVVINPADDDEDEDDQFSEEGEDGKVGPSPRKIPQSDDSLNFGVSTLEEIRLRKALKASMKRAGYPIQSADTSANGEKENIQSFFQPDVYEATDGPLFLEETGRPRSTVAERLGKRMVNTDVKSGGVPLKRNLADRLGRFVDEENPLMPPQKALKTIRERLGLSDGLVTSTETATTNTESKTATEQIRIKTLEEIRQEKAAKSQSQDNDPSAVTPEINTTTTKAKSIKRAITIRDNSIDQVKMFSELPNSKRKRQEEQNPSPTKVEHTVEKKTGKGHGKSDTSGPALDASNVREVRVKTLEEIRREKAARIQSQQVLETDERRTSNTEGNGAMKPRLLRNKLASHCIITPAKSAEVNEKPSNTPTGSLETNSATCHSVKVKTFEEIMHEKRLRKQEIEEQAKTSAEAESSHKHTAKGTLKKNSPAKTTFTSLGSSSPSSTTLILDTTSSTQKLPVRKPIPLKSKTSSPLYTTTTSGTTTAIAAVTSVPVKQSSSLQREIESNSQSASCSNEVPDKKMRNSTASSPAKQAKAAAQSDPEEATLHTADTKVRPKLNVKPSVMKPAVQVKPGQKRRVAERSAVAAVKPLNAAATVLEEPLQVTLCPDKPLFPSSSAEAQLTSAVPHSPSTPLDSGSSSSPQREDLQTVPVFRQSPRQEHELTVSFATPREACTVPQRLALKTSTQPKPRRLSAGVSRTTSTSNTAASNLAVDDFEELISEFTDDHMGEDMDPGIGEDDLLQELSEMIDS
ncbi:zinc finger CCCH domain-containing protein 11A isoform X2 [Mastacembelus armatus]|uniref:zinc finger CCCH domain-containing protein 11A isoform X2 n=1 Tax=Mastacembelus armatus TaxID=205130 RepID=UPI000E4600EC|nr:zinc finger CCCH domain-containing protein 11A-like isoform X2 [Mastacembelus armatus]